MKAIINGRVIVPDETGNFKLLDNHAVIYDKNIHSITPMKSFQHNSADNILDAKERYISPGFINVHIHGCGGFDTMDDDPAALSAIRKYQAQTGVTSFLPTTMTYDLPKIYRALDRIRAAKEIDEGAAILGCHMEGPFINRDRKGAQAAKDIIKADFSLIEKYTDIIKIITLAPETLGNDYSFAEKCRKNNIILSIGHSSADYDTAKSAITKHGLSHITHLFNAMPPFNHRSPGLIGAALDTDAICELITDNIHVHPMLQRLVYKVKDRSQILLITDSMRACLLGDGESELGGQKVYVKGQMATLADGTLAGSILTMDRAIANFAANCNAPLSEIIELVTKTPAVELGVYDKTGSLEEGKQADIAIFDDNVNISTVIVKGHQVYSC